MKRLAIRQGYSIIELVVALISTSVLMAGLVSALFVASRAIDPDVTPSISILRGSQWLSDFQADTQHATAISEQAPNAITVIVPDRTGDLAPETIRYSWSGTAGEPLTRQINGGDVDSVLDNVHRLTIDYFMQDSAIISIDVRIQVGPNPGAVVETGFAMVNRP